MEEGRDGGRCDLPTAPAVHGAGHANPIDFVGTYPLPEAQMRRFFLRISIGYLH